MLEMAETAAKADTLQVVQVMAEMAAIVVPETEAMGDMAVTVVLAVAMEVTEGMEDSRV